MLNNFIHSSPLLFSKFSFVISIILLCVVFIGILLGFNSSIASIGSK